ncbi:Hydroxyproline-rich glycoprotein family protein, putative isoform 2 [Hibiscus syriacus]|uniref:Hydroxyproline-rich glycoprotein family protein, putative isoform 2 n=2 Tax=Hibiscus syriacus TaxID=106335 RepID=A0A6A3B2D8_HIBSY|nr:Hydroxyproline-rich glycoprotein family protein, putative isoform 2 [Hibiscus syriacus]
MRGIIGRTLSNPNNQYLASLTKRTPFLLQSSPFSASSSSGDGRGRGRGRAGGNSPFGGFTPATGRPNSENKRPDSTESPSVGLGHGHGRGTPLSSESKLPTFSSPVSQYGSGRGRGTNEPVPPMPPPPRQSKLPIFIMKQDEIEADSSATPANESVQSMEPTLPSSIPSVASLSGAGRGKHAKQPEPALQMKEENRHIRAKQEQQQQQQQRQQPSPLPQMSKEEAVKKAREILSRSEGDKREDMGMSGGRGRGRGRQSDRGRGEEEGGELSNRVMPSPLDDAYLEAMHTNLMIEFEPEYLMADFETNPDIDEKPPMSLRDALEKVKPFLMSYEGIQNQEEWEEAIKETMDNVPLLQEIIDHYSGPDRVTAKKQQEVGKSCKNTSQECTCFCKELCKPCSSFSSELANRAVLSLQIWHIMRQLVCHGYEIPGTSRWLMGLTGTVFMVEHLLLEQNNIKGIICMKHKKESMVEVIGFVGLFLHNEKVNESPFWLLLPWVVI